MSLAHTRLVSFMADQKVTDSITLSDYMPKFISLKDNPVNQTMSLIRIYRTKNVEWKDFQYSVRRWRLTLQETQISIDLDTAVSFFFSEILNIWNLTLPKKISERKQAECWPPQFDETRRLARLWKNKAKFHTVLCKRFHIALNFPYFHGPQATDQTT